MREIKFRAWDEELKKMYTGDEIEDYSNLNAWLSYGGLAIYRIDEGEYVQLKSLQYTGLKDKNGKEIFEGDIVEYDGWFYIIKWDKEETGFYMHDKNNFEDDHLRMIDISVGEVMGNIYENQNLIK
ncbi:hypothetical protein JFU18_02015 [Bacillus sp. TH22]|uniref:YopX family protein n=1 Tax=unclassified Bacillus (in: firmicutes) TaxID=185979 RepID=UPI0019145BE7|nr:MULTISPECIES: YopX family protein [unclassified Bacillus (in: firmicutes)]MBK5447473.1 hypothetical protein [Bacillus sp. TH22]MBK5453667.1 hypothetical protein [Bacillus sp. TH23]